MSVEDAREKLIRVALRRLGSERDGPHAHCDDELEYCDDGMLVAARELVAASEPLPTDDPTWRLKPGTVVVLEGIDAAGKTTQMELLKQYFPHDLFIHSPSGKDAVGSLIYSMTEHMGMGSLTRQFLHLASHTEMYRNQIKPSLGSGGVFMDRNWISTLAYGRAAGIFPKVPHASVVDPWPIVVKEPAAGITPSLVFFFLHAYVKDPHNTIALYDEYRELQRDLSIAGVPTYGVSQAPPEQVTMQLLDALGVWSDEEDERRLVQ